MKRVERDVMVANDRLNFGGKTYIFSDSCLAYIYGDLVNKIQMFVEKEDAVPSFPMKKEIGSNLEVFWKENMTKEIGGEQITIENISIPILNKEKEIGYVKKIAYHDGQLVNARISVEVDWEKKEKNIGISFAILEATEMVGSVIVDKASFFEFEVIDE